MSEWNLTIPEEIYDNADRDVALPAFYERAVVALSECETIDEANQWKGTADAIIAYAKTLNDDRLEKLAKRIKARAYRRMGELLKQYAGNHNQYTQGTSRALAEQNGLSRKQHKTAVRLVNVENFDQRIEADNPLTITELAKEGTKKRTGILYDEKPEGFTEAMYMKGDIKRLFERMEQHDPLYIIGGMDSGDIEEMRHMINIIEAWCDTFIVNAPIVNNSNKQ